MALTLTKADIDTAAYESGAAQRYDYSGRGMYSEECWAVVGNSAELAAFEAELAKAVTLQELGTDDQNPEDVLDMFMKKLGGIRGRRREDSMGMNHVWYYPTIKVED